MPQLVVNGAQITCTFGTTPSALTALPAGQPVQSSNQLVARITDMQPMPTSRASGCASRCPTRR
jgi:hypothetical protein